MSNGNNVPTQPKQGIRAAQRNALQRIEALEGDLQRIAGAISKTLTETDQKLTSLIELVDALVAEVGQDQVVARVQATRDEKIQERANAAKAALDKALAEGQVVPCETIEENAIITGIEYGGDGQPIKPGYVQLGLSAVKPEFQEKFKGQTVGFEAPIPSSQEGAPEGKFVITGIYKSVPPPAPTAPTPETVQ